VPLQTGISIVIEVTSHDFRPGMGHGLSHMAESGKLHELGASFDNLSMRTFLICISADGSNILPHAELVEARTKAFQGRSRELLYRPGDARHFVETVHGSAVERAVIGARIAAQVQRFMETREFR
jgi:hypothetical protein